ncbi:MAG: acylneuraminate cytidylyltransferase family protein [Clostridium sp.]|nr:acylneuraminate cytidylyltransferase family protein [Prevotella sp.]MCM1429074.1 acylneuraminate cytidylyltransferase family protein [Clostridium sp.]MCM1475395.1 acylneuraminate cytidylyltransferase family protein [Muribaculaceae bacterium]
MKTLFLIPARGGSKGIPGKNIKEFVGIPLIVRTIRQALKIADNPEDVVVSTDSEQIARVARKGGANVPFLRPAELATDTSGTQGVIIHALDWFRNKGIDYERVVLLQTTSPLRQPDDIRRAINVFDNAHEADMAVSVAEAAANPYYDIFEPDANGFLHHSKGNGGYVRRQDAPKVWQYTGAVYVIRSTSLRRGEMSRFEKILPSPMDTARSVDLDTPADWDIAERRFRDLNLN